MKNGLLPIPQTDTFSTLSETSTGSFYKSNDLWQKHILTDSLPMHPCSTFWKHQKTLRFSWGQRKAAQGANGLSSNNIHIPHRVPFLSLFLKIQMMRRHNLWRLFFQYPLSFFYSFFFFFFSIEVEIILLKKEAKLIFNT